MATAAAGDAKLRAVILDVFVQPLIIILDLIRRYSLEREGPVALGQEFARRHGDRVAAEARQARFWNLAHGMGGIEQLGPDVGRLLLDTAARSEHVRWALWEPVLIYYRVLEHDLGNSTAEATGAFLSASIAHWAGDLPIEAAWGALTLAEAARELEWLEHTLLRDQASRDQFRKRLGDRFGRVTSVARLLD
jgi:hypothetical protein